MFNVIVYFVDDKLILIYKNNVYTYQLKNIISLGQIVDKNAFIENFLAIVKKEKIKSKLFGDNILILKNSFYNNRDLEYYKNIFTELGFLQVHFKDIIDFFKEDYTYIEINNSYLVINIDEALIFDLKHFKDIPRLIYYFKDYYKQYVVLFGTNSNIPNIKVKNLNIFYLKDYANYLSNNLLKVKKCDG